MVATAGKGWSLASSLVAMFDEADRRWPKRSRASDGSIGDAAHAARKSDHNPDSTGDVLAGDLTDDKAAGCDADLFAEHLRRSRDPRISYVICNGRVFRSYGSSAWEWTPYSGINGHFAHTHVSILDTHAAKNDTSPWFPYADAPLPDEPVEDDMPGPAIVRDSKGRRILFDRGPDGALWWQVESDGWKPTALKDRLGSAPCAELTANGVVEIAAYGGDGKTSFVCTWNGAVFSPWVPTGAKG